MSSSSPFNKEGDDVFLAKGVQGLFDDGFFGEDVRLRVGVVVVGGEDVVVGGSLGWAFAAEVEEDAFGL